MRIICVDNSYLTDYLTKGKVYDVIDKSDKGYLILDDRGVDDWHIKLRFRVFEETMGETLNNSDCNYGEYNTKPIILICLNNIGAVFQLSCGKEYMALKFKNDRVLIINDKHERNWYPISWFTFKNGNKDSRDKGVKGSREDSGTYSIRPNYYNDTYITPFDYIKANDLDFFEGNVIKYITRHRQKNGKEDLIKAITYIEELIKEYDRNE